jgi:hypothetical protein
MATNQNENELVELTIYSPDIIKDADDLNYSHIYNSIEDCMEGNQILGLNEIYKYSVWIVKTEVIHLPKDGASCG